MSTPEVFDLDAPPAPSAAPAPVSALARMWMRPPGWVFTGVYGVGILAWFWSRSVPGVDLLLWLTAFAFLGACAFAWLVRLIAFAVVTRGIGGRGRSWLRFTIAPAIGILALGLVLRDVPFEARWAQSRPAFASVVDDLGPSRPSAEQAPVDVPDRIGTYRISHAFRQGRAVVFYEANGALIDDAGFAYLPDGPSSDLANGNFENPQFEHLSGPWYRWTASW